MAELFIHGGPGSGFKGHKGRIGLVGGSVREGSSTTIVSGSNNSVKREVSAMVASIPEKELQGISKIVCENSKGPEIQEGFGHLSGSYHIVTREIHVYSNADQPKATVAHEVGHNVYNQLLDYNSGNFYERAKAKDAWERLCKKRYKKSRFISWYDSFNENPNETFAELYKEYNASSGRDRGKLHQFLLSDNQDDTELEGPFFDILGKVGQ